MAAVPVVNKVDNRNGIIVSILYLLFLFFVLFFLTYTEPDPPKVTVPIPIVLGAEGITEFDVNNGGGGSPSEEENPVITPMKEDPKEQATQEEESPVKVNTGKGKTTNNPSTAENATSPNPFSGTGNGGQGTAGTGTGLGSDTGPGPGSGDSGLGSGSKTRVRISNITSKPKTLNNVECKVALKLTVDSQGKVVRADVIRDNTTTTNQQLIDEVIALAKKEVKYEKKDNAPNEVAYYTVTIRPS